MFPLSLLGLTVFTMSRNERIKELFYFVWIPGLVYSFCIHLCSDQASYEILSACTVCSCISVVMFLLFVNELDNNMFSKMVKICLAILLLLQIGFEINLRWYSVYWEDSIKTQTELIENGPDKGIYVSKERYEIYEEEINRIENYSYNGDSILYLSLNPWLYLYNDGLFENCSYSAWLASTPNRIMEYYVINPDKIPNNIYAEEEYFDNAEDLARKYGYVLINNGENWKFYQK